MNEAAKVQAEAIFRRREAERAEFEVQLQAQRDKAQRLGHYDWPEKKRGG